MKRKRGAVALAAISGALLAVSLGYFALAPGAWESLGLGGELSSLLKTTEEAPAETGSSNRREDAEPNAASAAGTDDTAEAHEADASDSGTTKDDAASAGASSETDGKASGSQAEASSGGGSPAVSEAPAPSAGASSSPSAETPSPQPSESEPEPANAITVSVSVSSSAVGNPVSASGTYTLDKGATAYDALLALGLSVNASETSMGVYVAAIGGLAEKQHGATSGWMYAVNGVKPSKSAGSYVLHDGDTVSWGYVTG